LLSALSHESNRIKCLLGPRLGFHISNSSRGVLISKILCPRFTFTEL
jgi:hypothetical protein